MIWHRGAIVALLGFCACFAEADPHLNSGHGLGDSEVAAFRGVEVSRGDDSVSFSARAESAWVQADGDGLAEAVDAVVEGDNARPPLAVESERAQWELAEQRVRFEGAVVATRGTLELRCDVLEVRYRDPEHLENAIATGNVRVVDGERKASGAKAELTVSTGELVLTGSPMIEEGANTMRGEQIVLFLDDDRLVCTGCKLVVQGDALKPSGGERGEP